MLHALEVRPASRRLGLGGRLVQAAAVWAAGQGATRLSLVVTRQNAAACALYARLGMDVVGQYHYRMK
jgi:ribosomal protein S18 acetylase RimI-like enzyme